jgi:hypothetical protein
MVEEPYTAAASRLGGAGYGWAVNTEGCSDGFEVVLISAAQRRP